MASNFDITVKLPDSRDPFGENGERLDALYEAGCDDATFWTNRPGYLMASFAREGDQEEAVASAIADIKKAIPACGIAAVEFYAA